MVLNTVPAATSIDDWWHSHSIIENHHLTSQFLSSSWRFQVTYALISLSSRSMAFLFLHLFAIYSLSCLRFHIRACLVMVLPFFLGVWTIHLHLLLPVSFFTDTLFAFSHRSCILILVLFNQNVAVMSHAPWAFQLSSAFSALLDNISTTTSMWEASSSSCPE